LSQNFQTFVALKGSKEKVKPAESIRLYKKKKENASFVCFHCIRIPLSLHA